ncbi:hypothetical protein ACJIZ3_025314 [Penstemon smallii]|uniref:Chlororespiratory reduction 6 n=1 Tax=Penstemon smallii TaxID=265156 RepID=A0ABD3TXL7_9LAMI
MAASTRPLYPLPCPLKQSTAPSSTPPWNQYSSSTINSRVVQSQRPVSVSVSFNPSGNFDISLFDDEETSKAPPPLPPTEGRYEVVIDNDIINRLDLTPFHNATGITSPSSGKPKELLERSIGFTINYIREDEYDPRELSEFPDIRLWFVRLDAMYPWLPVLLDWRAGELARYAAMLALELFVMNKVFVVYTWLKQNEIPMPRLKAKDMARMLGFGIGDELFDLVDKIK